MQASSTRQGWSAPVSSFFTACLGFTQFTRVADALTRAPATACIRLGSLEPGGNAAIAARLAAAAHELGADAEPHPHLPSLAVVVRSRARRPLSAPAAAGAALVVDRRAGEAVLKGAELYVPGVIAVSASVLAGDAVEIFAAVEARPGEGRNKTGVALVRGATLPSPAGEADDKDEAAAAAESVAAAIARRAAREGGWVAVPIGAGRAQMTRSQMFAADRGLAVRVERRAGASVDAPPPPPMESILRPTAGQHAMQQHLPSIVAALALAPPPGSRVLDMCAAPGGKTTLLAWMVAGGMAMQQQHPEQQQQEQQQQQKQQQQPSGGGGGRGVVIALDRTHAKADEIRSLARDMGVGSIVDARKMDATQCCVVDGADEQQGKQNKRPRRSEQHEQGGNGSNSSHQKNNDGDPDPGASAVSTPPLNAKALQRACRRVGVMRARGILTPEKIVLEMRRNNLPEGLSPTIAEAAEQAAAAAALVGGGGGADEPRVVAAVVEAASAAALAAAAQASSAAASAAAERLPAGSFSHILLDAPCSATGIRPRLAQPHTLASLRRAAQYQRQLLKQAVRLLAPGGALVFSTCSISPLENEANVRWALDRYPQLRLAPLPTATCPAGLGGPGMTAPVDRQAARDLLRAHGRDDAEDDDDDGLGGGERASPSLNADLRWLTPTEAPLVRRFCPADAELDTIGFFVARFEKAAEA